MPLYHLKNGIQILLFTNDAKLCSEKFLSLIEDLFQNKK